MNNRTAYQYIATAHQNTEYFPPRSLLINIYDCMNACLYI